MSLQLDCPWLASVVLLPHAGPARDQPILTHGASPRRVDISGVFSPPNREGVRPQGWVPSRLLPAGTVGRRTLHSLARAKLPQGARAAEVIGAREAPNRSTPPSGALRRARSDEMAPDTAVPEAEQWPQNWPPETLTNNSTSVIIKGERKTSSHRARARKLGKECK